jgi:lysophospholipase L1-like esterase
MKYTANILLSLLCAVLPTRAETLRAGDDVAICGDSITEQRLYSVFIEDYLLMCQPVPIPTVQQFGWSGETMRGLLDRVSADVLPFRPNVVTLFYGMNDGGYAATNPKTVADFEKNTEAAVKSLQAGGARLVLVGSPGAVDSERFKTWFIARCSPDAYNQTLYDLGQAAKAVAEREGAVWVDVHSPMLAAMAKAKAKYGQDYPLAVDGVHPSFNGQLVIAYAFLKALGCTGDVGTITLDARTGAAEATEGHKILAASGGRIEIESSRYPFCFVDDPKDPLSTRAILDCVPFNEDLNRFRLIVHRAAPKMKVTWGEVSRVFTAGELENGVNLAAAFLDNPFRDAFANVEAAVKAQQAFETPAVKSMLNSLQDWRRWLPDRQSEFDELQAALIEKDRRLNDAAHAALRPVRHVLELAEVPAAPDP